MSEPPTLPDLSTRPREIEVRGDELRDVLARIKSLGGICPKMDAVGNANWRLRILWPAKRN